MATTLSENKSNPQNNSKSGSKNREKIFDFYAIRENWSKLLVYNSSAKRQTNQADLEGLIEQALRDGEFGKAHIYLHCLKDNAQGKYSFYSEKYKGEDGQEKTLDMPIWFRDARSDFRSQSSKTDFHDCIMKGLSYINMTLTLFEAQKVMPLKSWEGIFKNSAVRFFNQVKNSENLDSVIVEERKVFNFCVTQLSSGLKLDEDSAKNLLLKSLDLANLELPLCAKATFTEHQGNEILDIDVPIYELSSKLKKEYDDVLNKPEDKKPEWFKAQNSLLQNLITHYAPTIRDGRPIPANCGDILPGIRNAAEDRLYLYEKDGDGKPKLIYRGYHSGNLGHNIMRSRRSTLRRALESPAGIALLLMLSLGMLGFAIAACVFPLIPILSVVFIPVMIITSLLGFYAIYHLNAQDNVEDEDLRLTVMVAEQLKGHVDSKLLCVNTLTSPSIFDPSVSYLENQVRMAVSDLNPQDEETNEVIINNAHTTTPINLLGKVVPATNLSLLNQLYKKLETLQKTTTNNPLQTNQADQLQKDYLKFSEESDILDSENFNLQLAATAKQMAYLINQMSSEQSKSGHGNFLSLIDACKGGRDRGGLSRFLAKVNAIFMAIKSGSREGAIEQYLEIAIIMAVSGHVQSQCDLGSNRGNGAIKKVTAEWSMPEFLGEKVKKALMGEYSAEIPDPKGSVGSKNRKESKHSEPEELSKLKYVLETPEYFKNYPPIIGVSGYQDINGALRDGQRESSGSKAEAPRSSVSESESDVSVSRRSISGFWPKEHGEQSSSHSSSCGSELDQNAQRSSSSLPTGPSISINFSCG